MSTSDLRGLHRLMDYVHAAVAAQPVQVADQLSAAMREGRTVLRFEPSAAGPVAVVAVDGHDLAEVDVRLLLDDKQPDA